MASTEKPADAGPLKPRTFFLNERQELLAVEPSGGGRPSPTQGIDWAIKSTALGASFRKATQAAAASADPAAKAGHLFFLVMPEATVAKVSTSKAATGGTRDEKPEFGGAHALEFRKIGMELLAVRSSDGAAAVHMLAQQGEKVAAKIATLGGETAAPRSAVDDARWGRIAEFALLGPSDKFSQSWLDGLDGVRPADVILRFHAVLAPRIFQQVLRALELVVGPMDGRLTATGRDLLGGHWVTARLSKAAIRLVAATFSSLRWIHGPREVEVAGFTDEFAWVEADLATEELPARGLALPKVCVVDVGVPQRHRVLHPYFLGQYFPPLRDSVPMSPQHGSQVASAVVFGPIRGGSKMPLPPARCTFYSVDVGKTEKKIHDMLVVGAMQAARGIDPDLRVFVLSFAGRPLATVDEVTKSQHLHRLAELETFAFMEDALLTIAAGNSEVGQQPKSPYPKHVVDPQWGLGAEAHSFNALVVGGLVHQVVAGGIGNVRGAPSPFTRIGPGLQRSPVPGFSGHAGDLDANYGPLAGAGLNVCDAQGQWAETVGTSFAAPYVAREAAMAMAALREKCPPGTAPFAATVKAFLHLTANRPKLPKKLEDLAKRTLGVGFPRAQRLQAPTPQSAVFVWQTALPQPRIEHRVQFPVPLSWLQTAKKPVLRVVCAWLTPVNDALADGSWATRAVTMHVLPFGMATALRGSGITRGHYPLLDREFDLSPDALQASRVELIDQNWVIGVSYQVLGPDMPAMAVQPVQRVGLVLELRDDGPEPVSPQSAIQALPIAAQLDALPVYNTPVGVQISVQT